MSDEFLFIYSAPLKRALWLLTYRRDLREAPLSNGHFDVPRFINGVGWGEGGAFIVRSVQFEYTRLKDTQSPGAILLLSCISSAPMLKSRFDAQGGPTLVGSASVFELLALTWGIRVAIAQSSLTS
jgi:hypothetical protein